MLWCLRRMNGHKWEPFVEINVSKRIFFEELQIFNIHCMPYCLYLQQLLDDYIATQGKRKAFCIMLCLYASTNLVWHTKYISVYHISIRRILFLILSGQKRFWFFWYTEANLLFPKIHVLYILGKKDTYRPSKRSVWNSWTVEIIINVYYELGYSTLYIYI